MHLAERDLRVNTQTHPGVSVTLPTKVHLDLMDVMALNQQGKPQLAQQVIQAAVINDAVDAGRENLKLRNWERKRERKHDVEPLLKVHTDAAGIRGSYSEAQIRAQPSSVVD